MYHIKELVKMIVITSINVFTIINIIMKYYYYLFIIIYYKSSFIKLIDQTYFKQIYLKV